MLAELAEPLVEDIAKKIASTDGAVHADETYWTLDAHRAYYWVHCTEVYVHFQFDMSRAGEVSRKLLGPYFDGTLVTDCYAGYEAHPAKAKQKCLAHLARTARDWQKVVPSGVGGPARSSGTSKSGSAAVAASIINAGGANSRRSSWRKKESWLRAGIAAAGDPALWTTRKRLTLQSRIRKHAGQWLVFLDDPRVPPTNNLAERALRPLVVLRKITFGHRSQAGAKRMATLMTVQETAKRHQRRPTAIFYRLYTHPPNRVLRYLYAGRRRSSRP